MTVLSVVGGKGPGPIEGEEPDHTTKPYVSILTDAEISFYSKVKEFLGDEVNDQVLVQAIKCHGTQPHISGSNALNEVIGMYFDRLEVELNKQSKQVRFDDQLEPPALVPVVNRPSSFLSRGTSTDRQVAVVDISDDEKNAKGWGSVPKNVLGNREEQDVIKAIEESLKDNQNMPGFSPFAQKDPENPYDRKRHELTPVGLKNIGNSCWFNVIMQMLYHIPRFRQMLFDAKVKPHLGLRRTIDVRSEAGTASGGSTGASTVVLLAALRKLAASLKASSRAYVDPTDVLKTINDLNTVLNKAVPCIGIQQDATEMLLRMIEWLEQAFKETSRIDLAPSSIAVSQTEEVMDTNDENVAPSGSNADQATLANQDGITSDELNSNIVQDQPFNKLFHGAHIEIRPSVDSFTPPLKLDNSLQLINLDVTFDNLYDSLEAYHLCDAPSKELWFETLPSVIIFSLVRFSYKNGQTEKVHSKFQFPCDIYMDRYLYRNRNFVNEKRFERDGLKKKLSEIRKELQMWEQYPVGETHLPLPVILDAAAKYISTADIYKQEPVGDNTPEKTQPMDICDEVPSSSGNGFCSGAAPTQSTRGTAVDVSSPGNASLPQRDAEKTPPGVDVSLVHHFLQALSSDAQKKILELQREANSLQESIDCIFDVDGMHEEPYRLHSVMVHEGEANVGHYWAYISSHPLAKGDSDVKWRKFNDRSVEPATWHQIEEDSFGLRRACSAYCLVYTRRKCDNELYGPDSVNATTVNELVERLPSELKLEVAADNAYFDAEMIKWDDDHPPIELGPQNRPDHAPSKNPELLEMITYREPLDLPSMRKRHYSHAARFYGGALVESVMQALNVTHDSYFEREESASCFMQELLSNYPCHLAYAIQKAKDTYADRLVFMIEWSQIYGIPISPPAKAIFLLRMLAQMDFPNASYATASWNSLAAKYVANNAGAESILNDAHCVFELFCQLIAVLNDIIKRNKFFTSGHPLRTAIQLSRMLCASLRMHDKVEFYICNDSTDPDEKHFFTLTFAALLIFLVCRTSVEFFRIVTVQKDDSVLREFELFLERDYKALITRLHNMRHEACDKAVQYVLSLWNQIIHIEEVPKIYQALLDASEQETVSSMPLTSLNVMVVNSGHDLFTLRQGLNDLGVRGPDDLDVLLRNIIHSAAFSESGVSPQKG